MNRMRLFVAVLALLLLPVALGAASLEDLARQLDSPNAAMRLDAVRRMGIGYNEQALTFMVRAAADPDELVRERAVQGLGNSASTNAVPPARNALSDPVWFVRWRAVQALGRLGARDVVEDLAPLVRDENWQVKTSALELLGTLGVEELKQKNAERPAVSAGGRIRSLLGVGLENPDERVKLAAAGSLARLRDGAAFAPLLDLLRNGSLFTRDAAALALGDLGDQRAVEPLLETVVDPRNEADDQGRDWARWGAVKALAVLTGQDFGLRVDDWRQWLDSRKGK